MQGEQRQYGLDFSSAEAERFFLIEQALRKCQGADLRHVELCRWIAAATAGNGQPLRRRVCDLAQKLWCSEATARRVVRELARWGLLVVEETGGSGGQRENAYGLDWPAIRGRVTGGRPPLQPDSAPCQPASAPSQSDSALRKYPQGSAKAQQIPLAATSAVRSPAAGGGGGRGVCGTPAAIRRGLGAAGDRRGPVEQLAERLVGLGCWPDAARGVLEGAVAAGLDGPQFDAIVEAWRSRGLGPGGLIARLRRWRPGQAAAWGFCDSVGPDPLPVRLAAAATRQRFAAAAAAALDARRQAATAEAAALETRYGPQLDRLPAAELAELARDLPPLFGPAMRRQCLLERLAAGGEA